MAMTHRGHLQTRLQTILTSIDQGAPDPYFYTQLFEKEKGVSLIAIFNNGIDPDPLFSGSVVGRIYLDPENNLCLALWPLTKDPPPSWRKEILLPAVKAFEFEFLGKITPPEHGVKEKSRPINAALAWKSHWSKTVREIPGVIRLTVYEEGVKEPSQYAFILPVAEPFVTYTTHKAAI